MPSMISRSCKAERSSPEDYVNGTWSVLDVSSQIAVALSEVIKQRSEVIKQRSGVIKQRSYLVRRSCSNLDI